MNESPGDLTVQDEESGQPVSIDQPMRLEALRIHDSIVLHGSQALDHIYGLGTALAQMRDRRLYLAMGHGNFEKYCQAEIGMSRDWADDQITMATTMTEVADAHRQIPSKTHLKLLGRLPAGTRKAFVEDNNLPAMTTRQVEDAIREANQAKKAAEDAKRESAELARRLDKANRRADEAETREPTVIEKTFTRTVNQDTPETKATVQRLARDLAASERQRNELLAKADGTAEAQRGLDAARKRIESAEKRLQRLSVQFDDEGRDQYGGSKLMDAVEPVQGGIAKTLAEVRVLKRVGVGGACDDDTLKALLPQLRELADSLDEILKDRASRPINVTPTEVM